MKLNIKKVNTLSPTQMIVFSFIVIISIGTILLCLPWATEKESLSFVNALFTAVSATCVTGLTVVDIGSEFTLFGQIVVLILIQLGGLGIMTFSTFFLYLLGKRVSIRGREIIDMTLTHTPVQNIGVLLRKVITIVFFIEGIGFFVLTLKWMNIYPLPKAMYHGLFHAVSAFCNAGFSLYQNSFIDFSTDIWVNCVLIGLIILGGVGFIVLLDFQNLFRRSKPFHGSFSFHSKVVLFVAFFLILVGTLFLFGIERIHSLIVYKPADGFLIALFQSVTARTAGFNTIDIGSLSNGACLIIMFLMFVGAAPGSCGGGVKVSTMGILVALFISRLRGHDEPNLFYRSISQETTGKALIIVLSSILLIGIIFLGLLLTENWILSPNESREDFIALLFETISAFGTVGLSMGITSELSMAGRLLVIVMMFVGRLGPLTMAVALTRGKRDRHFSYARGEVMVG